MLMSLFFLILHVRHAFGRTTRAQPAVHERIKIAIHDGLHVAGFHAGAQIFDHAIRLKNVAANLISPRDAAFIAVKFFHVRFRRIDALRENSRKQQASSLWRDFDVANAALATRRQGRSGCE